VVADHAGWERLPYQHPMAKPLITKTPWVPQPTPPDNRNWRDAYADMDRELTHIVVSLSWSDLRVPTCILLTPCTAFPAICLARRAAYGLTSRTMANISGQVSQRTELLATHGGRRGKCRCSRPKATRERARSDREESVVVADSDSECR
jgi:hypothetical protein